MPLTLSSSNLLSSAQHASRFGALEGGSSELFATDAILSRLWSMDQKLRFGMNGQKPSNARWEPDLLQEEARALIAEHPLDWLWMNLHARGCSHAFGPANCSFDFERWMGAPEDLAIAQARWGPQAAARFAVQALTRECDRWLRPYPYATLFGDLWSDAIATSGGVIKWSAVGMRLEESLPADPQDRLAREAQAAANEAASLGLAADLIELARASLKTKACLPDWNPALDRCFNPVWLVLLSFGDAHLGAPTPPALIERALDIFVKHPQMDGARLAAQAFAHDPDLHWALRAGKQTEIAAMKRLCEQGVDPIGLLPAKYNENNAMRPSLRPNPSPSSADLASRFEAAFGQEIGSWALALHEQRVLGAEMQALAQSAIFGAGSAQEEREKSGDGKTEGAAGGVGAAAGAGSASRAMRL